MRFAVPLASALLFAGALVLAVLTGAVAWIVVAAVLAVPVLVAAYDLAQRRHSILRNYPLLGHMRFALEAVRPELQQYFIERNYDGRPYDRDTRTAIYERAKGVKDEQAYGTERDVAAPGYEWLLPSTAPFDPPKEAPQPRVRIRGPGRTPPLG